MPQPLPQTSRAWSSTVVCGRRRERISGLLGAEMRVPVVWHAPPTAYQRQACHALRNPHCVRKVCELTLQDSWCGKARVRQRVADILFAVDVERAQPSFQLEAALLEDSR